MGTRLLALPLVALSVLAGHAAAYALTGADPGTLHEYLGHVPQLVLVLAVVAILGLVVAKGRPRLRSSWFGGIAVVVFVVQEHLERLLHTGHLPFLATDRTFIVGVLLQLAMGALVARLARRAVVALRDAHDRLRVPRLAVLPVARACGSPAPPSGTSGALALGRGPPAPARP